MKILLWIRNENTQKALANKIAEHMPIAGIITESRKSSLKRSFKDYYEKIYEKLFLPSVGKAWWKMLEHYQNLYPEYPKTEILDVENINSEEAYNFSIKIQPDLIIVSGTRLVKEKMLSIAPSKGITNLHTGLSPYIKGGPNCTNWCIATKNFHLIGNTVMWIDLGIDTGNLITTELTPFSGKEKNLLDVHITVMEHAHDLYIRALKKIYSGETVPNVPQNTITNGITFYNKQWNLQQKKNLIYNFPLFLKYLNTNDFKNQQKEVITVSL